MREKHKTISNPRKEKGFVGPKIGQRIISIYNKQLLLGLMVQVRYFKFNILILNFNNYNIFMVFLLSII